MGRSLLVVGKGDLERSALVREALQLSHGFSGVLSTLHLDEASAFGVALAIVQQASSLRIEALLLEQVHQVLLVRRVSQVTHQDTCVLEWLGLADHGSVGASERSSGSGTRVRARCI